MLSCNRRMFFLQLIASININSALIDISSSTKFTDCENNGDNYIFAIYSFLKLTERPLK